VNEAIQHPEYTALLNELRCLQDELAHALGELDHLLTAVRPYLLALYQQTIGAAELDALRIHCKSEWMRRFAERIRAARNRAEPILIEHIEAALHAEMASFWSGLHDAAAKVNAAQHLLGNLMQPKDAQAFRSLYYRLVKRLHPDVNPDVGPREKLLWQRVQQAYQDRDMQALEVVWQSIETMPEPTAPGVLDTLQDRKTRLLDQLQRVQQRMDSLAAESPFDLREKLEDKDWVQARLEEIAVSRRQSEERLGHYRQELHLLMGDKTNGIEQLFDEN
jgi:hypothetical protein